MIRSELEEIVGAHFISVKETDKLVYSTDWSWMPQMWLDRGERLPTPDYIVHPGSAEEIAEILLIANKYHIPVVPWGGGSGTQGGALPLFGGILVDTKRMDKIIEIDEKSLTARQPGRIFTRAQLLDAIHGVAFESYERAIDAHIKNIRRKIEIKASEPEYILTVYGVGYKFTDK